MKSSSVLSIGFGGVVATLMMTRDVKAANAGAPEHDDSVHDACANFTGFNFEELFGGTNYSFAGYPSECTGPIIEYQDENERYPDFIYPSTDEQDLSQPLSILFYAPWCTAIALDGMKSKYVEFARDVSQALLDIALESGTNEEPATPLFYTLSCDAHVDLCDDQGIEEFPTLRLFPPGSSRIWTDYRADDVRQDLQMSCWSMEEMEDKLEGRCSDCSNETLDYIWLRYENAYENAVTTTFDIFHVETPDLQEDASDSVDAIGVEHSADHAGLQEPASGSVSAFGAEDAADSEETNMKAAWDGLEDNFIDPASSGSATFFSTVVCSALLVAVAAIV